MERQRKVNYPCVVQKFPKFGALKNAVLTNTKKGTNFCQTLLREVRLTEQVVSTNDFSLNKLNTNMHLEQNNEDVTNES